MRLLCAAGGRKGLPYGCVRTQKNKGHKDALCPLFISAVEKNRENAYGSTMQEAPRTVILSYAVL